MSKGNGWKQEQYLGFPDSERFLSGCTKRFLDTVSVNFVGRSFTVGDLYPVLRKEIEASGDRGRYGSFDGYPGDALRYLAKRGIVQRKLIATGRYAYRFVPEALRDLGLVS